MAKLTARQKRFIGEYLVDLNATQAALRAGYSEKSAGKIGFQLLEKTRVQEEIDKAMRAREKRTNITQDMVLEEYRQLGFSKITDYLTVRTERILVGRDMETNEPISEIRQLLILKDTSEIPEDKLAAIAEIKETQHGLSFKLHDKKGALDSIAKHLGMFIERLEHTGKDGGPIETKAKVNLTSLTDEELEVLESIVNKSAKPSNTDRD